MPDSRYAYEQSNLLIEAYKLEGEYKKAQEILWARFEKSLSTEDYLSYIKQIVTIQHNKKI